MLFFLTYVIFQSLNWSLPLAAPSSKQQTQTGLIYHGPHPNTELTTVADGEVLGQEMTTLAGKVVAQKRKTKNKTLQKTQDYGIAAGGGLTYLGQKSLNKYFKSLKSLGVQWVRWDLDWSAIQPDNADEYQWEGADRVAVTAKNYGINSLGIITYAPKWAAVESCNSDFQCEPADSESFGRFAGEAARRYKDTISYWEIWNEPNYAFFWEPEPDAEKYAEILREAYIEIKRENPQAVVLSGGLAAVGNETDGSISPIDYMRVLYEVDANQYFDAVALHPYTYPALPKYNAWWNRWQQILPIRQLMDDNGDGTKKTWITEFGAPTGGPGRSYKAGQLEKFTYGVDYMKKSAQRDIMKEATSFYREHSDWMGPFFWYSLRDSGKSRSDTENFFGLLDYKGKKKPAYKVFKKAIKSKK